MGTLTIHTTTCIAAIAVLIVAALYSQRQRKFTATEDWQQVLSVKDFLGGEEEALNHVWSVLTDFDEYSSWNTFTTQVILSENVPKPGTRVTLHVHLDMFWPLNIRYSESTMNIILDFQWLQFDESEKKMCWGIRNNHRLADDTSNSVTSTLNDLIGVIDSVLDSFIISNRCAELKYSGKAVWIKQTDENFGIIAPLVEILYKEAIEKGFRRMGTDLARKAALLL